MNIVNRKHERYDLSIAVDFELLGSQTKGKGLCVNLSEGGAFVRTGAQFSAGEQVELLFYFLDPDAEVKILAEVMWNKDISGGEIEKGFGVRFLGDSSMLLGCFNACIDQILAGSGA